MALSDTSQPPAQLPSTELQAHVVESAATYIDGQLRLATAADQRASSLAGVFTAAGTALIAGVIAFSTIPAAAPPQHMIHVYPVMAAGIACAAAFLVAGILCIASALPVDMYLPGSQPNSWKTYIKLARPYEECLKEESGIQQEKIDENRVIIKRNAKLFSAGALVGISGPFIGLLVWLITSSVYWLSALPQP
jgi:hypothetical protein